jgi:hypothetical protein
MRGVWLGLGALRAALRIELPHEHGIFFQSLRSADILNAMAGPQAVRRAKRGQAAFGADAGASEDEEAIGRCDFDVVHEETCRQLPTAFSPQLSALRTDG